MSVDAFHLFGEIEARTDKAVSNIKLVDKHLQATQTEFKNTDKSTKAFEKGLDAAGSKASKNSGLISGFANSVRNLNSALNGNASFNGSGMLSTLANVSEIIQGIPQIGALAGALVRPLMAGAQAGIAYNDQLERAQISFETLTGSADEAKKHIAALQSFAEKTPFQFTDLVASSQELQAFGYHAQEIIPLMTSIGNAISATGDISKDKLDRVVLAFGEMRSNGRLNARQMLQLTEAGIPAWDLLAKSIGKSVEQTRKLSEQGKLDGAGSAKAISAMLNLSPEQGGRAGLMDRLSKTYSGMASNLEDIKGRAQGVATKPLFDDLEKMMDAGLKRGDLATSLATGISTAITPVSGLIRATVVTTLGGGITGRLVEAFKVAEGVLPASIIGMAEKGILEPFRNLVGIHSPSTVFMGYGEMSGEGFKIGFANSLTPNALDDTIDQFLGHVEGKFTKEQEKSAKALAALMQREPQFKDKLIEGSRVRGINPDHLLNVMAIESGFNKSAQNKFGYTGLIQLGDKERKEVGMPQETWFAGGRAAAKAFLDSITATQQLDYVFKFLDSRAHGQTLDTQSKVYATVGAGSYVGDDETVRWRKGSRGYANNPLWDANHDGLIQNKDFGMAAITKLAAGVKFTINGGEVSQSNPLPVNIMSFTQASAASPAFAHLTSNQRPKDLVGGASSIFTPTTNGGDVFDGKIKPQLDLIEESTTTISTVLIPRAIIATNELGDAAMQSDKAVQAQVKGVGEWGGEVIKTTGELGARLKELRESIPSTKQQFEDFVVSVPERMGDVLGDAVKNWDGTFKGFFKSVAQGFAAMLQDLALQLIKAQITKGLTKLLGNVFGGKSSDDDDEEDSGGGGGFNIGSIAGVIKNLFGGSAHANGGDFPGGKPILVGERGPEVIFPRAGGSVMTNEALRAGGGGGGGTVNNYMTFVLPGIKSKRDAEDAKRILSSAQTAEMIHAHLRRARG
jgi:tape measure domain-containing protein